MSASIVSCLAAAGAAVELLPVVALMGLAGGLAVLVTDTAGLGWADDAASGEDKLARRADGSAADRVGGESLELHEGPWGCTCGEIDDDGCAGRVFAEPLCAAPLVVIVEVAAGAAAAEASDGLRCR